MNEYQRRYVEELGGPFSWWHETFNQERFEQEIHAMHRRPYFVIEYAWAIPSEEALDLITGLGPIVEIGAGGGYWAMLLRERGADVVAYDQDPEHQAAPYAEKLIPRKLWSEVLVGDAAMAGKHPDRTLFLCWPPFATPMGHDALKAYLHAGGQTLIYIGEEDGCTADESFFRLRDRRMVEDKDLQAPIPQWPGMHDYLSVYRAKMR